MSVLKSGNQSYFNGSVTTITPTTCNVSWNNFTGFNISNCKVVTTPSPSSLKWEIPYDAKIFLYAFYSLIFFIGTFGNIVVIYSVGFKKKRRTSNDIFLISLAVADLLGSIFVPLVMISDLISGFSDWYFGEIGCSIIPWVSPLTMAASSWSLVAIAVDRLRMIKYPLSGKPRSWLILLSISFIWGIATTTTIPYLLALKLKGGFCWDYYHSVVHMLSYFTVFPVVNWPIPLFIMIITYVMSAKELKRGMAVHANNAAIIQRMKQNQKIVTMFIIIVAMFFTLTTPYAFFLTTYHVLVYMEVRFDMNTMLTVNYTLSSVTALNSCINPVVYARKYSEVKNYILEIFSFCKTANDRRSERYKQDTSAICTIGGSTNSFMMSTSISGTQQSIVSE